MIDLRFPTALQLLLTLALAEAEGMKRLSSSTLANGLGANPSFVRKLLIPLAEAGLVESAFGRDGGVRLGRAADRITLREIYLTVTGDKAIWEARVVPHLCPVSSNMECYFGQLTADADRAAMSTLEGKTLADSLAAVLALDRVRAGGEPPPPRPGVGHAPWKARREVGRGPNPG
jgi:Rrf2 family transcriptional repressor of oqxAB